MFRQKQQSFQLRRLIVIAGWKVMLLMLSLSLLLSVAPKALLALPTTQVPSQSVEALQQWHHKVEQYRTGVSQQRQQLQQLEKAAQNRLERLQQNIQATSAQVRNNEDQLHTAAMQLRKLEADLVIAYQAFQTKRSATAARLRFLQRRRTANGWATLLQSSTLEEFLDRRYQLRLVYQADQRILIALKGEADQINAQKNQVELKKNEIALLSQQLLSQKADYETQAQVQQKLVTRLNTDRQAMEAAQVRLAADSKNLGLLIQQRLGRRMDQGRIVVFGTGRMSYPSEGPITSSFGWRLHPVLGSSRFHAGMDFGAEQGSAVRAADRGTVIFAGWYGGYGNAVIVDHGNGVTTLYGHASQLYVEDGQVVQRGQAIAAVGSTGLSTGPHLHFEIRQNGEPIDPLAYL
ncbi:MAG TPA: peptidoglycan DD-metalloendopeptidase family protein [Candidatus Caenarcaniphilales bacterium]